MSTDVMIVEEAEYEEGEEERSVAVDSTSTAVGSADSEDENNSGEENSVQCECCEARQTCGQAGKICNGLHPLFFHGRFTPLHHVFIRGRQKYFIVKYPALLGVNRP